MVRQPQRRATDVSCFKGRAIRVGQPALADGDAGVPREGGPWRGLSEERWLVQLLQGAPAPRDSAHAHPGLVAHG
jgi:hypothetical protein